MTNSSFHVKYGLSAVPKKFSICRLRNCTKGIVSPTSRGEADFVVNQAKEFYVYAHESLEITSKASFESKLATQHTEHLNNLRLQATLTELASTQKNAVEVLRDAGNKLNLANNKAFDKFVTEAKSEGERIQDLYAREFAIKPLEGQEAIKAEVFTRGLREQARLEALFNRAVKELGLNTENQTVLRQEWRLPKQPPTSEQLNTKLQELDIKLREKTESIAPRDFKKSFNNPLEELEYWATNNSTNPATSPEFQVPTNAWIQNTTTPVRTAPQQQIAQSKSLTIRVLDTVKSWFSPSPATPTSTSLTPATRSELLSSTNLIQTGLALMHPLSTSLSPAQRALTQAQQNLANLQQLQNTNSSVSEEELADAIARVQQAEFLVRNGYPLTIPILDNETVLDILNTPGSEMGFGISENNDVTTYTFRNQNGTITFQKNDSLPIPVTLLEALRLLPQPGTIDLATRGSQNFDDPSTYRLPPATTLTNPNTLTPSLSRATNLGLSIASIFQGQQPATSTTINNNLQNDLTPALNFTDHRTQWQQFTDWLMGRTLNIINSPFGLPNQNDNFPDGVTPANNQESSPSTSSQSKLDDLLADISGENNVKPSDFGFTADEAKQIHEELVTAISSETDIISVLENVVPVKLLLDTENIPGEIKLHNDTLTINKRNIFNQKIVNIFSKILRIQMQSAQYSPKSHSIGIFPELDNFSTVIALAKGNFQHIVGPSLAHEVVHGHQGNKQDLVTPAQSIEIAKNIQQSNSDVSLTEAIQLAGRPRDLAILTEVQSYIIQYMLTGGDLPQEYINQMRSFIDESELIINDIPLSKYSENGFPPVIDFVINNVKTYLPKSDQAKEEYLNRIRVAALQIIRLLDQGISHAEIARLINNNYKSIYDEAQWDTSSQTYKFLNIESTPNTKSDDVILQDFMDSTENRVMKFSEIAKNILSKHLDQADTLPGCSNCSTVVPMITTQLMNAYQYKNEKNILATIDLIRSHTFEDVYVQQGLETIARLLLAEITHQSIDITHSRSAIDKALAYIERDKAKITGGDISLLLPIGYRTLPNLAKELLETLPVRNTPAAKDISPYISNLNTAKTHLEELSKGKDVIVSPLQTRLSRTVHNLTLPIRTRLGDIADTLPPVQIGLTTTPNPKRVNLKTWTSTSLSLTENELIDTISSIYVSVHPEIVQDIEGKDSISAIVQSPHFGNMVTLIRQNAQLAKKYNKLPWETQKELVTSVLRNIFNQATNNQFNDADQTFIPDEISGAQPRPIAIGSQKMLDGGQTITIIQKLGGGGFGDAWLAIEQDTNALVVYKTTKEITATTHPKATSQERRNLQSIIDQNIVDEIAYLREIQAVLTYKREYAAAKSVARVQNTHKAKDGTTLGYTLTIYGNYIPNTNIFYTKTLRTMIDSNESLTPQQFKHLYDIAKTLDKYGLYLTDVYLGNIVFDENDMPVFIDPLPPERVQEMRNNGDKFLRHGNTTSEGTRTIAFEAPLGSTNVQMLNILLSNKYYSSLRPNNINTTEKDATRKTVDQTLPTVVPQINLQAQSIGRQVGIKVKKTITNDHTLPGCSDCSTEIPNIMRDAVKAYNVGDTVALHQLLGHEEFDNPILQHSVDAVLNLMLASISGATIDYQTSVTAVNAALDLLATYSYTPEGNEIDFTPIISPALQGLAGTIANIVTPVLTTLPIHGTEGASDPAAHQQALETLRSYAQQQVDKNGHRDGGGVQVSEPSLHSLLSSLDINFAKRIQTTQTITWDGGEADNGTFDTAYDNLDLLVKHLEISKLELVESIKHPDDIPADAKNIKSSIQMEYVNNSGIKQSITIDPAIIQTQFGIPIGRNTDFKTILTSGAEAITTKITLPPVQSTTARQLVLYQEILGLFRLYPKLSTVNLQGMGVHREIYRSEIDTIQTAITQLQSTIEAARGKNDPLMVVGIGSTTTTLNKRYLVSPENYGQGGLGIIKLAWDTIDLKPVIIKTPRLDSESIGVNPNEAIITEAKVTQLANPSFKTDSFTINNISYLVMDYISGPNLRTYINSRIEMRDPLTQAEILTILTKTATQIDKIHSTTTDGAQLIHRDIKPGNIIVNPVLGPTIIDFGLTSATNASLDSISDASGTDQYQSKNQWNGGIPNPVDDNRALIVIAFNLLTNGQRAYPGDTRASVMLAVITDKWNESYLQDSLRHLSPSQYDAIKEFFNNSLTENLDFYAQYPTTTTLIEHLQSLLQGNDVDQTSKPSFWTKYLTHPLYTTSLSSLAIKAGQSLASALKSPFIQSLPPTPPTLPGCSDCSVEIPNIMRDAVKAYNSGNADNLKQLLGHEAFENTILQHSVDAVLNLLLASVSGATIDYQASVTAVNEALKLLKTYSYTPEGNEIDFAPIVSPALQGLAGTIRDIVTPVLTTLPIQGTHGASAPAAHQKALETLRSYSQQQAQEPPIPPTPQTTTTFKPDADTLIRSEKFEKLIGSQLKNGGSLLDYGTGKGNLGQTIAINHQMDLTQADAHDQRDIKNQPFIKYDRSTPSQFDASLNNTFDNILMVDVLHNVIYANSDPVQSKIALLKELIKLLKSGGKVIIISDSNTATSNETTSKVFDQIMDIVQKDESLRDKITYINTSKPPVNSPNANQTTITPDDTLQGDSSQDNYLGITEPRSSLELSINPLESMQKFELKSSNLTDRLDTEFYGSSAFVYESNLTINGDSKPVAIKVYRIDTDSEPIEILKTEIENAQVFDRLGIGPRVYGWAQLDDGRIGLITDKVDRDDSENWYQKITQQSIDDLYHAEKILWDSGYVADDVEPVFTSTGRFLLIDAWGISKVDNTISKLRSNNGQPKTIIAEAQIYQAYLNFQNELSILIGKGVSKDELLKNFTKQFASQTDAFKGHSEYINILREIVNNNYPDHPSSDCSSCSIALHKIADLAQSNTPFALLRATLALNSHTYGLQHIQSTWNAILAYLMRDYRTSLSHLNHIQSQLNKDKEKLFPGDEVIKTNIPNLDPTMQSLADAVPISGTVTANQLDEFNVKVEAAATHVKFKLNTAPIAPSILGRLLSPILALNRSYGNLIGRGENESHTLDSSTLLADEAKYLAQKSAKAPRLEALYKDPANQAVRYQQDLEAYIEPTKANKLTPIEKLLTYGNRINSRKLQILNRQAKRETKRLYQNMDKRNDPAKLTIIDGYIDTYLKYIAEAQTDGSLPQDLSFTDLQTRLIHNLHSLTYQDYVDSENLLGDHGLRHLVQHNITVTIKILDEARAHGVPLNGIHYLMAIEAQTHHDEGYSSAQVRSGVELATTDPGYIGIDVGHNLLGAQIYRQQLSDSNNPLYRLFSLDQLNLIHTGILWHDDSTVDLFSSVESALTSAIHIADNTHAFETKLPEILFGYPDSLKALRLLKTIGAVVTDKAEQKVLVDRIVSNLIISIQNNQELGLEDKKALTKAARALNPIQAKFNVGRISGHDPQFTIDDSGHVTITAEVSEIHQLTTSMFNIQAYDQLAKFIADLTGRTKAEILAEMGNNVLSFSNDKLTIHAVISPEEVKTGTTDFQRNLTNLLNSDTSFTNFYLEDNLTALSQAVTEAKLKTTPTDIALQDELANLQSYRIELLTNYLTSQTKDELSPSRSTTTLNPDFHATNFTDYFPTPLVTNQALENLSYKVSDSTGNQYTLTKRLGGGKYGDAYLAISTQTNQEVVIKIPKPNIAAYIMAMKEDQYLKHIEDKLKNTPYSKNFAKSLGIAKLANSDNTIGYILEYIPGITLEEYQQSNEQSPNIKQEIVDFASVLDEHNLPWNDIWPSNIMITPDGHVVFLDPISPDALIIGNVISHEYSQGKFYIPINTSNSEIIEELIYRKIIK